MVRGDEFQQEAAEGYPTEHGAGDAPALAVEKEFHGLNPLVIIEVVEVPPHAPVIGFGEHDTLDDSTGKCHDHKIVGQMDAAKDADSCY